MYVKLIFLVSAMIVTIGEMCIFKPAVNTAPKEARFMPLNDAQERRTPSEHSCVCGEDHPGTVGQHTTIMNQKWILYVHLKLNKFRTRLCIGTIVNSNMVITSHRCLRKSDRISVYDVLRANKGDNSSLAVAKEIILSNEINLSSKDNVNISVKTIIYSERFAYDYAFEEVPESDVAILVVDYDFTKPSGSSRMSPICLPTYNVLQTSQLLNREGYYQGIREYSEANYHYDIVVSNYSTITTAETCNKRGRLGVKPVSSETLCLMFTQPSPTNEGGPLRININRFIEGGPKRSFLVGISSWVQKNGTNAGHKYAYFANVNSFVKYIEHHAIHHNSTWCHTPNPDDRNWPWEGYAGKIDASINCTCGFQDMKYGRVVGGENGTFHEFPWLTRLRIPYYERNGTDRYADEGYKTCGGSVINNRMVLTAAHCVARGDLHPEEESFNLHNHDGNFTKYKIYLFSYYSKAKPDKNKEVPIDIRAAENVFFHPGYSDEDASSYRVDFDIALIILKEPLILGMKNQTHPRIDPICLPQKGYLAKIIGKNVTVAGWGAQNWGESLTQPPNFKKVDIPIRHYNECAAIDQQQGYILEPPTDTKFCASTLSPWQDAGAGDSGGPLMHRKDDGRMVQVGIVSYGRLPPDGPAADKAADRTTTYFAYVEAFLPYIYYYSNKYNAKFCSS